MSNLDRFFKLSHRGSNLRTEVRAGLTTFLMMAYILLVNPQILSEAGMPIEDVIAATGIAAAIGCIAMGLIANFPFALAPGMGLNAFFTYGVVLGLGVSWQSALAAVFIAGIIFLSLSFTGLRTRMIDGIPQTLKLAITTGIGLFLAIIGFRNMGLSVDHPATLLTRGSVSDPAVFISIFGIILIAILMVLRIRGAILLGIVVVTLLFWVLGLAPAPENLVAAPVLPSETLLALDFSQVAQASFWLVIIAILFVDIFDTAGTLIGVGRQGGFLDQDGRLVGSEKAFFSDAVGTTAGALLGTSPVTSYIESAAGVEEGGRTGITAIVVGFLFLISLVFLPIIVAVPAAATAPALIVVGAMMMEGAREIDWKRIELAVPSFLTIVGMPFTYSIADGISLGIVSYTLICLLTGRYKQVSIVMYVLTVLLLLYFGLATH